MQLKAQYQHLPAQAIWTLCQNSQQDEDTLVQVYNLTLTKNDKLTCFLSDGHHCAKAFLKDKHALTPGTPTPTQDSTTTLSSSSSSTSSQGLAKVSASSNSNSCANTRNSSATPPLSPKHQPTTPKMTSLSQSTPSSLCPSSSPASSREPLRPSSRQK
jgi:hypothetical protein